MQAGGNLSRARGADAPTQPRDLAQTHPFVLHTTFVSHTTSTMRHTVVCCRSAAPPDCRSSEATSIHAPPGWVGVPLSERRGQIFVLWGKSCTLDSFSL